MKEESTLVFSFSLPFHIYFEIPSPSDMYGQQWSCDVCTFKQSANAVRCAMCNSPNPFMVGAQQSGAYYQPQPPPKPKPVVKDELLHQAKPRADNKYGKIMYQTERITKQQVLDTYAIYLLNKDIKSSSVCPHCSCNFVQFSIH